MSYDITDFDPFTNYYGNCKCGGTCPKCSSETLSYSGCGCEGHSNFTGDEFLGLSVRQAPQVIGDGTPQVSEPAPEAVAPVIEPKPERTYPLGLSKKHLKYGAIAIGALVAYKLYMKKNG